ncbi:hypothetical protein DLP3_043 [Stenotrophomonas phage vB_SmaS_DLP_3]|nr:hypothetical protein DLP3_043 [Stenotrophomonas phage vB_SmaS_DLP_3]
MAEFFCDNPKCQFHFAIPATMSVEESKHAISGLFSASDKNPFFPKAKEITSYKNWDDYAKEVKYQATIQDATIGIGAHMLLNGVSDMESHHSAIEVDGMTITGRFCSCCMQMFDFMGVAQVQTGEVVMTSPIQTINMISPLVIDMDEEQKQKAIEALLKKNPMLVVPEEPEKHQAFLEGLIDGMTLPNGLPMTIGDVASSMTYKGVKLTPENTKMAMDLLVEHLHHDKKPKSNVTEYKALDEIPIETPQGFDGEPLSSPFASLKSGEIKTVDQIFEEKIKLAYPEAIKLNGKWWTAPDGAYAEKIKSGILKAMMTDATHEFALQDFEGKKASSNSFEEWANKNNGQVLPGLNTLISDAQHMPKKGLKHMLLDANGMLSMEGEGITDEKALKEQAHKSMSESILSKLNPQKLMDAIKGGPGVQNGLTGKVTFKDAMTGHIPPVHPNAKSAISTHPEFVGKVEPQVDFLVLEQKYLFLLPSGKQMTFTKEGLEKVKQKLSSHFSNVTFEGKPMTAEDKEWLLDRVKTILLTGKHY